MNAQEWGEKSGKWVHMLILVLPSAPFVFSANAWANGIKVLWEAVVLHVSELLWRCELQTRAFTKMVKNDKVKQLGYSEGAALIPLPHSTLYATKDWDQRTQIKRVLKHCTIKSMHFQYGETHHYRLESVCQGTVIGPLVSLMLAPLRSLLIWFLSSMEQKQIFRCPLEFLEL